MKAKTLLGVLPLLGIATLLWWSTGCARESASPSTRPLAHPIAKHVLVIGLDGARADAIRDHAGPAIRSLIDNGACCWTAEAVLPSVTQVNWPSILTGCAPAKHGVVQHPVTEEQLGAMHLKVPTLFEIVAQSGGTAAGFLGHWKLYPLESTAPRVHVERSPYAAARVAPIAAAYLVEHQPTFCFVYFGDLDGIGHRDGWMSPPYIDGIANIDRGVATLIDALKRAEMFDNTVVVITSDHGGHDKSHGEGTPEDRQIPWIIAGPGIRRGAIIDRQISTTDTAPTILRSLGLPVADSMDGAVVAEAFVSSAIAPQAATRSAAVDRVERTRAGK